VPGDGGGGGGVCDLHGEWHGDVNGTVNDNGAGVGRASGGCESRRAPMRYGVWVMRRCNTCDSSCLSSATQPRQRSRR
jgi:hypothetical protein